MRSAQALMPPARFTALMTHLPEELNHVAAARARAAVHDEFLVPGNLLELPRPLPQRNFE